MELGLQFSIAVMAGGVLIYAGLYKLLSPEKISETLQRLARRPRPSLRQGRVVGLVELMIGISLPVTLGTEVPAVTLALLGISFAVAGTIGSRHPDAIPCNCFASSTATLGIRHVLTGLAVIAAGAALAFLQGGGMIPVEVRLLALGAASGGAATLALGGYFSARNARTGNQVQTEARELSWS